MLEAAYKSPFRGASLALAQLPAQLLCADRGRVGCPVPEEAKEKQLGLAKMGGGRPSDALVTALSVDQVKREGSTITMAASSALQGGHTPPPPRWGQS